MSTAFEPPLRRVALAVAPILFLDALMFSILAPLLPHYAESLDLGTASAGILSASFAAGNVVAAIPAGMLASRVGGKRTLLLGVAGLGVSSVLFGLADHVGLLGSARFLQGAAGSAIWAGGLTWAATIAAEERRATVIGSLMGVGIAGALFGPLLGSLAVATSPALVFGAIPVLLAPLAFAAIRSPDAYRQAPTATIGAAMGRPFRGPIATAMTLVLLPSICLGLLFVLGPLRLAAAGAATAAIGTTFMASGAVEAGVNPIAGRITDRIGTRRVLLVAYSVTAALLALLALPDSVLPLAVVIVLISAGLGTCWSPTTVRLHDAIRAAGAGDGHAFALYNLAWAGGQVIGGSGGGALAQLSGDLLPCLLASAGMIAGIVAIALGKGMGPSHPTTKMEAA